MTLQLLCHIKGKTVTRHRTRSDDENFVSHTAHTWLIEGLKHES